MSHMMETRCNFSLVEGREKNDGEEGKRHNDLFYLLPTSLSSKRGYESIKQMCQIIIAV